jgi:hypothetical protein
MPADPNQLDALGAAAEHNGVRVWSVVAATQQATDFAEIADAFRQLGITAMRLAGQIDAERQDDTTPRRSIADAG